MNHTNKNVLLFIASLPVGIYIGITNGILAAVAIPAAAVIGFTIGKHKHGRYLINRKAKLGKSYGN
jgi:hypothetical protein